MLWVKAKSRGLAALRNEQRSISHCSQHTQKFGKKRYYSDPYSLNLAPCDFYLFPLMKKHVQGRRFSDIEEIRYKTTKDSNEKKMCKKYVQLFLGRISLISNFLLFSSIP